MVPGPGGFRDLRPKHPRAVLFTFLVGWAYEHGLNPEDVWEDYLRRPRSYILLSAYSKWSEDEQKTEQQRAKDRAKQEADARTEQARQDAPSLQGG